MKNKKVTIDDLAIVIEKGFTEAKKDREGTKKDVDDLAMAVKAGFDGVDKQFKNMNKRFVALGKDMNGLKQGQERIELRLDNVAYRFELVELEKRVKKVELKLGLKSS